MVTYQDVYDTFKEKGCTFLIQEEEFNKTKHSTTEKYKYIAACGHEHEVWLNVFKNRGTGINCPKCIIKEYSKHQRETYKEHPNKLSDLEYDCVNYFRENVNHLFEIKLTREGCLVNIALKPKNVLKDLWIMVHIKSTYKPSRTYSFKCSSKYENCVLLCICQSDKRMWALNGNAVNVSNKISIGLNKSKYTQYELSLDNISETFNSFYNLFPKYSFEKINNPVSKFQKLEVDFIKHRENKINLDFQYNEKKALVFDFLLNGFKVQEKVGQKLKNEVTFALRKSNGVCNRIRQYTSYKKNDADFYWLNCPNRLDFYVIPEAVLIKYKYVDVNHSKYLYLKPCQNNNHWSEEYLFNYDTLNIDKIKQLFKIY